MSSLVQYSAILSSHPKAFLRVLSEALEAGAEPGERMMKAFETEKNR